MENTCIFAPDSLTMNGTTFPAGYSIPPHGDGSVFVFVTVPGKTQPVRIRVTPDDPQHAAALAAANGQQEQPAYGPKQARGPVPDKTWIGSSIQGIGWKIEFCPIFERTRVIFDKVPSKEARELVKTAGFCWSPKMGSWNKGLTWKAYRAAQKLATDLGSLSRRAC